MDVRRYGWTFETGFIRSTLSKSRPKNVVLSTNSTTKHNFFEDYITQRLSIVEIYINSRMHSLEGVGRTVI